MKYLIAYYSRTGTTKKVAEFLAKKLKADIEKINDRKKRKGILGYLNAGMEAFFKQQTKINGLRKKPSDYDIVVIGTPVWAFNMPPAIRTYLEQYKDMFRKIAFFCTMGGFGDKLTFTKMAKISKKPIATLSLKRSEVLGQKMKEKIAIFLEKLRGL